MILVLHPFFCAKDLDPLLYFSSPCVRSKGKWDLLALSLLRAGPVAESPSVCVRCLFTELSLSLPLPGSRLALSRGLLILCIFIFGLPYN
ncbi:uncharacterized protein BO87DRAFT_71174 [Aspergillus neoniger CBS 115656]|uniref:Uncharacterized protein n=1 Tax=Aspergillus neoniger (strain CBS 115656) TaxID=1448310 RepID=A0A318YIF9_ASPNB|nr:hypothetical protein BO87DRAFT_71174 [Aspergillus neoniger CBS 115656]PYH33537.1 hypothetical protein BO87DRAFT_71174 [Aspergillus neoniger CBS 115656]